MSIKALLPEGNISIDIYNWWQDKRQDIRARFLDNIGPPPLPRNTRGIEMLEEIDCGGYLRHKISYLIGEKEEIPAYLLVPTGLEGTAPAILAMHQTNNCGKDEVVGLGGSADFAYGHELALRGYVVLVPDYLTAGERVYPGFEDFDSAPFYQEYPNWSMVGKDLQDSLAAIDVLHNFDFVDKNKIGVVGHSHGGSNAMFAMALDERIAAGVSNCGMSVISEEDKKLEWSTEDGYIYFPKLRKYLLAGQELPFDLNEVAALIAPRPWCNISAYYDVTLGDQSFLAQVGVQLYQVYDLFGESHHFGYFMHGNDHSFPQYARSLAYNWLDSFLKT